MGQRLNIEIKKKDKVLANCYYHWSGFSNSAVNLALDIIKNFEYIDKFETKDPTNNKDLLFAIKLLEKTGAGVNEIEATRELLGNEHLKLQPCKSRNDGIIRNNRRTNRRNKVLGRGKSNN